MLKQIMRLSPHLKLCKLLRPKERYSEASYALVNKKAFDTVSYRRRTTEIDWENVRPEIKEFWVGFHKECVKRNIPVVPSEFYRSPERQQALYVQGFSKAQKGQSPHQWGCAVDIIHSSKGWDLTQKQWEVFGAIGKEVARKRGIKVVWGGDWTFYDPAHWELYRWEQTI